MGRDLSFLKKDTSKTVPATQYPKAGRTNPIVSTINNYKKSSKQPSKSQDNQPVKEEIPIPPPDNNDMNGGDDNNDENGDSDDYRRGDDDDSSDDDDEDEDNDDEEKNPLYED